MAFTGIITALQSEANCLKALITKRNVVHKVSGIGPTAAKYSASQLCYNGCNCLISFGYAGALSLQYHSGALVIGHSVSDGKNTIDINSPRLQELGKLISKEKTLSIHEAAFLSTSLALRNNNEKISHNPDKEWDAVEMESYGIAEIAKEHGIPVLIIRAIVDELDTIIPKGTENMIDVDGRQKFSTTFLELIKTPSDLKRYLKLANAKSKADKTLRRVATIIAESSFT